MKIERINSNNKNNKNNNKINYKGALDGVITSTLRTLDTNPMANAVGIDLFAMVAPRTYVDTKERNKYAGAETFFREFTGTLIVCLSASLFAKGISKLANKIIKPNLKINTNSWFTKDSLSLLSKTYKSSKNNPTKYVSDVLNGISGRDGKGVNEYKNINWNSVDWIDEKKWNNIIWDNKKYNGIQNKLKSDNGITETLAELIYDNNISKKDKKNLLDIIEARVVNAFGVSNNIQNKTLTTNIPNLLRDTVDLGEMAYKGNLEEKVDKINKINNIKSIGAISLASGLGLINQYINRKITEKRTGTKGFVGDVNYNNNINSKTSTKNNSKQFFVEKLLVSAGMVAMALGVMKVKSVKDFVKKLEFTGPINSGNTIKTVYASTLIGRFLASDNQDELRETATRDYLGFLNWLVFGGFAAKGVANLLDRKRENLFNEHKKGKGLRHWLNDLSLKSHSEIASKGVEFAKKNMWKLNIAHASGLAYSTIALGFLLPKLNIFITNKTNKNKFQHNEQTKINYTVSNTNFTGKNFRTLSNFRNKIEL